MVEDVVGIRLRLPAAEEGRSRSGLEDEPGEEEEHVLGRGPPFQAEEPLHLRRHLGEGPLDDLPLFQHDAEDDVHAEIGQAARALPGKIPLVPEGVLDLIGDLAAGFSYRPVDPGLLCPGLGDPSLPSPWGD